MDISVVFGARFRKLGGESVERPPLLPREVRRASPIEAVHRGWEGLSHIHVNVWLASNVLTVKGADLDEPAVEDFLMTQYPRVVAAVQLITGNRAVSEDCVQEALARAWEASERGYHLRAPAAWIVTTALNLARSWLRRLAAERRARGRLERPSAPEPDDVLEIRECLRYLPRRQREVTVLRYWLGMEVAEIATALGVSEGTVKTSLFRARTRLEQLLSPEQGKESSHAED